MTADPPSCDDYYRPRRDLADNDLTILAELRIAVIATVSPSGDPHMAPCWYLYENNTLLATVHTQAQRARNIARAGRARIMIEHTLGYISAVGPAQITQHENIRSIHDRIANRYLTETGKQDFLNAGAPDDAVIEITPTQWTISDITQTSIPNMLRDHTINEITGWFAPLARRDP